jgi:hypothetical protein
MSLTFSRVISANEKVNQKRISSGQTMIITTVHFIFYFYCWWRTECCYVLLVKMALSFHSIALHIEGWKIVKEFLTWLQSRFPLEVFSFQAVSFTMANELKFSSSSVVSFCTTINNSLCFSYRKTWNSNLFLISFLRKIRVEMSLFIPS